MSEDLSDLSRLRAWSHQRQGLAREASSPAEALREVVAVYSSHPTAPLAMLARSGTLSPAGFRDLEAERAAIRIPAMRQSIFLVPAEDAARVFAATRLPMSKHVWRLQYAGLTWDEYAAFKERVLERLQQPVGAAELQDLGDAEQRVLTGVRLMTYEGLVLRLGTSLRSDNLRYVGTASWLGKPLDAVDPDEATRWLSGAYLRGYGPARIEDFAWWAGLPRRRAAAALKAVATVDVGGGLLLPAEQLDDYRGVSPLDPVHVDVLPKWDAYTMGHAPDGRQRLLDYAHLKLAYSDGSTNATSGDGLPLVLQGGRAVASWAHRFRGKKLHVRVAPFGDELPPRIHSVFDDVGTLLDASGIEVEIAPPST